MRNGMVYRTFHYPTLDDAVRFAERLPMARLTHISPATIKMKQAYYRSINGDENASAGYHCRKCKTVRKYLTAAAQIVAGNEDLARVRKNRGRRLKKRRRVDGTNYRHS